PLSRHPGPGLGGAGAAGALAQSGDRLLESRPAVLSCAAGCHNLKVPAGTAAEGTLSFSPGEPAFVLAEPWQALLISAPETCRSSPTSGRLAVTIPLTTSNRTTGRGL